MHLYVTAGLATRLFGLLSCSDVPGLEGFHFLTGDYSVTCFVGGHASMVVVAAAFIFLYIAGIPLGMFLVLWKNRNALWDEKHPKHEEISFEFGSLYSSCRCFFSLVFASYCSCCYSIILFCFCIFWHHNKQY